MNFGENRQFVEVNYLTLILTDKKIVFYSLSR